MTGLLIFYTFILSFATAIETQSDTGHASLELDSIGQWSTEFLLQYELETGQKFSMLRPPAENSAQFLLYTRINPNYTVLGLGNTSEEVLKSGFDPNKETKVLIHGWLSSADSEFSRSLKDAYLKTADCNVIAVEWSDLAMNSFYLFARMSVESVGGLVASFLDFLVTDADLDVGSLHVIGHSLGAHIAGVCGQSMRSGSLTRITGLDPASILFSSDPGGRLDESDADFVDIIHTSGLYIGYIRPIGHVDFYPNGGTPVQPGCGLDIGTCTHSRAHFYFTESVHSDGFVGIRCDTWSRFKDGHCDDNVQEIMGEHVSLRFSLHLDEGSGQLMGVLVLALLQCTWDVLPADCQFITVRARTRWY